MANRGFLCAIACTVHIYIDNKSTGSYEYTNSRDAKISFKL
jgi:hypothetical protein